MEKRRRSEESDERSCNQDHQQHQQLLSYIFEIGRICETSLSLLHTLQTKIENIDEKVNILEKKSTYLEKSLEKSHYYALQEVKNKDIEILALKELNENMIKDYESKIELYENALQKNQTKKKDESLSFYS
jgi:hypothetical protein